MSDASVQQEVASASEDFAETMSFNQRIRRLLSIREFGPFVVLIAQLAIFSLWDPTFRSGLNISNMLNYVPELGIIALGMTLLLTAGEFDLSVGSVFGFTQSVMFILVLDNTMSMEVAFVFVLLLAALNGLIIGLLVTKLKISSFLVTLAMMLIVRGLGIYISDGFSLSLFGKTESWMREVLVHKFEIGGIKIIASMFWWLGLAAIMHFILNETVFGNWIMATGGNVQSAKARGTNTDRVKISLFMLTSVLAAFASVISAFRISQAAPISGNQYELEVIAMVVIGGTLLNGGRGTIIGSVIGALLLRSMRNGINFVGIPGLAFPIFIGLIILLMLTSRALLEKAHLGDR
jgi:simple sugar transport system permease protein